MNVPLNYSPTPKTEITKNLAHEKSATFFAGVCLGAVVTMIITLFIMSFHDLKEATKDLNHAKNWNITVEYGNGRFEVLDQLESLSLDTEAGELITVDWDGEKSTWNLNDYDVAREITISWENTK